MIGEVVRGVSATKVPAPQACQHFFCGVHVEITGKTKAR